MKVKKSIAVDVPANKVWDVLWNQYGQVGDWASTVNRSSNRKVTGDYEKARACESTWGEINEIVDTVDEKNMEFKYHADGLPFMMKSARSNWRVMPRGENASEIQVDMDIQFAKIPSLLMGWMMKPKMRKDLEQTFEDLRVFINTGEQTQAKIKSDLKFFKKHPKAAA